MEYSEKTVLITGGTGFIGRFLVPQLVAAGWQVVILSRQSSMDVTELFDCSVKVIHAFSDWPYGHAPQACINLAGEGIMDGRWNDARKHDLYESRVGLTNDLADWLNKRQWSFGVLISGSAVGYYGAHDGEERLDESVPAGHDFAAQLCADWEKAALDVPAARRCVIRTGLVLHPRYGVLAKLLPGFRLGGGGPIGSGKQVMSWIHIDDMVAAIVHLLNSEQATGVFNMAAPYAATNREFASALASILRRPAFIPVPGFMLQLLLGEGAAVVLTGQRAVPVALEASGFSFTYPRLEQALSNLL